MLTIPLCPAEFIAMIAFISRISRDNMDLPLQQQTLSTCVLLAFHTKLRLAQVFAWSRRDARRAYRYRLPTVVALALHREMQYQPLSVHQQTLLLRIDQAITDYQMTPSQRYLLTSLVGHA